MVYAIHVQVSLITWETDVDIRLLPLLLSVLHFDAGCLTEPGAHHFG